MSLLSRIRPALRALLRSPRISLAVVVCVALGVTATGAVLSLVAPTLLRPLPFPDADRLVRIWLAEPGAADRVDLAYADLTDLGTLRTLDRLEASVRARLVIQHADGGRRTEGEAVTDGYFGLLGAEPSLGRFFEADEHRRGERVMVLSHAAWTDLYGRDPAILGSTISTNSGPWMVVGVAASRFGGSVEEDSGDIEFWLPVNAYLRGDQRTRRDLGNVWSVARLGAGTTIAQAASELDGLSRRVAEAHPRERSSIVYRIEPFGENWRAPLREGSTLLLVASGLLLLVAAVNVAGLLFARALERRRELAVRVALGASRVRAAGILVGEAVGLVLIGGVAGIVAGPAVLDAFLRLAPEAVPHYVTREPGIVYMLLSLAGVTITAVIASGGPALLGARTEPMAVIREGGRGHVGDRRERRWGAALIVCEVALTLVLVVSAGLLVRSFRALGDTDLGFRTANVLRIGFFPDPLDAPDADAIRALSNRARDALAAIPGVEQVGRVVPTAPLIAPSDVAVRFDGMPATSQATGIPAGWYSVDAHFFDAFDIPVLAGRAFDATDRHDGPRIAIVSSSLARRLGGVEEAVGRTLRRDTIEHRIVGVVADARFTGPRAFGSDGTQLYTPVDQDPGRLVSFILPTRGDPLAVVNDARRVLASLAPRSALDWIDPVDRALGDRYQNDRFRAALVGAFSAGALLLAGVGLFAVLANLVARSRAEFGVRLALGADPGTIVAHVVKRGLGLVLAGIAIGVPLAGLAVRIVRASLYGVGTLDPLAWAGAGGVLLAVGLVASWWPARRAARVSPLVALRSD